MKYKNILVKFYYTKLNQSRLPPSPLDFFPDGKLIFYRPFPIFSDFCLFPSFLYISIRAGQAII